MKILVAGGAGFVGSHLVTALLAKQHEVIVVDNFFTGHRRNLKHLQLIDGLEIIRHDVTQPLHIEVDTIFNLACPASPVHYQKYPVQTMQASVMGSINLLELAKRCDAKILQASTSEVYGDPNISPQVETYWGNVNPVGVRACYDEGKRSAETIFMDYHRQFGTKIKIARIFNTYGPRMALDDGRVVSNFIIQALKGDSITIYGKGNQTRSFCYVSDLVEGLIKLMDSSDKVTGPVNLGNPVEFTMIQLAQEVLRKTGSKSRIVHQDLPSDDPKQRKPDISLAQSSLNWSPSVELDEGLDLTIDYFKKLITR